MASFPLKTHIFLPPPPWNFVRREHWCRTNYRTKIFFSMTQRLSTIHLLLTDRWKTDDYMVSSTSTA